MTETDLVTGAICDQLATLDGIVLSGVVETIVCCFEKGNQASRCASGKKAARVVLSERIEGGI